MSHAIGKHLKTIREQRQILQDWTAYEYDLDKLLAISFPIVAFRVAMMSGNGMAINRSVDAQLANYHHNLDVAEKRLKVAAAIGGVVDITKTQMGQDAMLVVDPRHAGQNTGNKHRIRAALVKLNFYEKFGRPTEVSVSKLTVQRIKPPKPDSPIENLAAIFLAPTYEPVVIASFTDRADAMLYRLSL